MPKHYTYQEVLGKEITVDMDVLIHFGWRTITEIFPSDERGMMVKYPTLGNPYHPHGLFILENERLYTSRREEKGTSDESL